MKPVNEFRAVIFTGLAFAAITSFLMRNSIFTAFSFVETVIIIKIFFTSLNIVLLTGLFVNYIKIHQEIPTSTSRSFLIFSASLLLYALSSSPLVRVLLGFDTITVGLFTYLPDMFTSAATITILYESYK